MLVGTHAEVLDGLTAVLGSTEDQGVASGGGTESKLIQGDSLTTGSGNSGTSSGGESQSGDGGLGERQKSVVIGDSADNDDGALLALLVDVGNNSGQRNGRAVDLGHEESSKDNLVEGGIGSAWDTFVSRSTQPPRNRQNPSSFLFLWKWELTGQEAVKLDQELQVDIVALGGLAVSALDVVAVEIDTWKLETVSARWFMLKCGCSSSRKRASRSQRRYTRYHHHSHTQAMHISSFTYPWRRLVLKSLMMGLKVEVENVWEYRRTFQPKISGLSNSIGALIGYRLD